MGRTRVKTELVERVTVICDIEKRNEEMSKYHALGYTHVWGGPKETAAFTYDPSRYKMVVERPFVAAVGVLCETQES